jgi:hypothetical protein
VDNLRKRKAKGDNPERKSRQMKLVSRVNAIIYGKDNPERIPDLTACRFGVGLTTPPCKKIKLLKDGDKLVMPYVPSGMKRISK